MRKWRIAGTALVVLVASLLPATIAESALQTAKFEGVGTYFHLAGSNGYEFWVTAYSRRRDGKGRISIMVAGEHAAAYYRAPARVVGEPARDGTATAIKADLGALGKVDLLLERSGEEKSARWKCGGPRWTYEPGIYRGVFDFEGEGGYTGATATEVTLDPLPLIFGGDCNGSGSGETRGPGIPGAVLKGLSFAHDRVLNFQVNKNSRRSKVVYTASLREQHEGVYVYRMIEGTAGPNAFRFDPDLMRATLSPPAPFSGSATARRERDSLLLSWQGNLELSFPGRTIPLAGANIHISLQHAHFTRSGSGNVKVGI